MKTAILAVYFGSFDTNSMNLLEQDLQQAFPDARVCRAFLRSDGTPSVMQALPQLQNYDRILVQPMLVSEGPAFRQLQSFCPGLPMGMPLLASPEACARAVACLPRPLILMGHGSAGCDQTAFAARLPDDIHFALLHGTPALEDLLPKVAGQTVHLAPFLLTRGKHTHRDLILWKQQLEAAGCTVVLHEDTLAYNAAIRSVFVQHVQAAFSISDPHF